MVQERKEARERTETPDKFHQSSGHTSYTASELRRFRSLHSSRRKPARMRGVVGLPRCGIGADDVRPIGRQVSSVGLVNTCVGAPCNC